MLARFVPAIIPPAMGTAVLTEVAPLSYSDPYSYSYQVSVTITATFAAPPGSFGWRAYVATSPSSSGPFGDTPASSFQTVGVAVNNLTFDLNSQAGASNYLKVIVVSTDQFGNVTQVVTTSNLMQMPARKKLFARTYADAVGSFNHPVGPTQYDVFFTSNGGTGSGEIPGAQCWGGGGAGVRINGLTVDSADYFYDTRKSASSAYLRKTFAGNTSDQIYALSGSDATVSPYNDGTGASAATLAGFFAGGTLIANNAGQTGGTPQGAGATVLGGRSGIHAANNPIYPGQNSSFSSGLSGLIDFEDDGVADLSIFFAIAYGCGGYSVTFPGGFPTFGTGQSGCVQILYYE